MPTLDWVGARPKLSYFCLDRTTVTDGDMGSLLKIDRTFFPNKSHYNCKCKCIYSPKNDKHTIVPTFPNEKR